jgi:hypothetical protein
MISTKSTKTVEIDQLNSPSLLTFIVLSQEQLAMWLTSQLAIRHDQKEFEHNLIRKKTVDQKVRLLTLFLRLLLDFMKLLPFVLR